MINIEKESLLVDVCNVMGMFKSNETVSPIEVKLSTGIKRYVRVPYYKLNRLVDKECKEDEPLLNLSDISLDTGFTRFSTYFYEKACKICELLGQDFEFMIYECLDEESPILLINSYGTAFIIAPRERVDDNVLIKQFAFLEQEIKNENKRI